jgi:tRNA 2-thiouridine synthesizing protein E
VIHALRDEYRARGIPASAARLTRLMEARFGQEGGKRYLYGLFPGGPVSQACRIGGLPLPPHTRDDSFGIVQ